jgi:hypothetical protein
VTVVVTDRIVARIEKRIGLFRHRGLDQAAAGELAELLALRDADLDDRRMCIECSHLQRDGGCFAARQGWINQTSKGGSPQPAS